MKRSLLIAFNVVFLALCTLQAHAYKKDSIFVNVNGQKRNIIVFTPNELPAKSPLFIVTHGMNQSPEYQYDSDKMYQMIDTAKFVVTYLRSDGSTWDTGGTKDQNFVIKTIDEMASRHNIDRDRVYWSGFSMGSMLIHHCIPNMQNKIAAFAPTSGIQFSEQPWNNCKKPVNLLEVIAYGDDVFGYEKYGIHAYIENYAKHDNHTRYSKTAGYRTVNGSWYDGDLEKWTGGPNGGEVWLYSYNNGGHWPMDLNRHLIWNFCKRFTLNQPSTTITAPAGETTHLYMAPSGEAVFPDITIEATAKAAAGTVEKLEIYDGSTLIESLSAEPFTATLTTPTAGKHELRAVATDSNGKRGESSCMVNYITSIDNYDLAETFNSEGIVPQNWYVCNGKSKRVGGGLPYTNGCRILHFTNDTRGFDYGLLVQNPSGKEKRAWAKFGDSAARSRMTLHAGRYGLKYKVCNWDQSTFTPVTFAIENAEGQEVASQVYTPTVNIGGNTENKFSGVKTKLFKFSIPETGDYVLSVYADGTANSDFVLGQTTLYATEFTTGIDEIAEDDTPSSKSGCFDLSGRRVDSSKFNGQSSKLKPGLYIIDGRKIAVK